MRLGLNFGYWGSGPADNISIAREAERLGYHSLWTAEAYGSDAVTPLVWLAAHTERINVGTAIMQMAARTPAMTAMTAATIDLLTGGRFMLGIGASGPQVVEGWHGVVYGKLLTRTREYVEIVRSILKREQPLEHHGEYYDIPVQGGTGLGLYFVRSVVEQGGGRVWVESEPGCGTRVSFTVPKYPPRDAGEGEPPGRPPDLGKTS